MRKIYSILMVATVVLTGCTDNETLSLNNLQEAAEVSEKRSYEEALQIAQSSIAMIEEDEITTRSARTGRTIDLQKTKVVKSEATRAGGVQDTLFYVFNFADDQGFAVVSANAATEGLIAVTEEANYDDCLEINNGFADYMKMAETYMSVPKRAKPRIPFVSTDTLDIISRGPYLTVRWGQDFPEGVFFQNGCAGCVNVAILQILSYFSYPTQITLSYNNADSVSVDLEWSNMKAHKQSYSYLVENDCSVNYLNAHSDIAHLCRQIGKMTNSVCKPTGVNYNYDLTNYEYHSSSSTESSLYNARNALMNLDYSIGNTNSYYSECTRNSLNQQRLIFMCGTDTATTQTTAHAWVVDGYRKYYLRTTTYATAPPSVINSTKYYNHINWGWNGIGNGYFLDQVFAPRKAAPFDKSNLIYLLNDNFNYDVRYYEVYR